jgi:DNA-binding transcriptional LysR family regulator
MHTPSPIDLNRLWSFAAVADTGGFTAAAERLGVAKAKLSLDVARLESQLGTTLFHRTTRRVALSEAGQRLHAACAPLLGGLHDALAQLGGEPGTLAGSLRIGASVDHGAQSLAHAVAAFGAQHPGLAIELRTSDRVVDPVSEGLDLSFRVGWLRDSSQRSVRLADVEQVVVASPAYLRAAGVPRRPQDLAAHRWIALTLLPSPLTWTFTGRGGRTQSVRLHAPLRADASSTVRALLLGGAGISVLNTLGTREDLAAGRLVRVLPDWTLPSAGLFAVYPPGRYVPANARAFVAFYRARIVPATPALGPPRGRGARQNA